MPPLSIQNNSNDDEDSSRTSMIDHHHRDPEWKKNNHVFDQETKHQTLHTQQPDSVKHLDRRRQQQQHHQQRQQYHHEFVQAVQQVSHRYTTDLATFTIRRPYCYYPTGIVQQPAEEEGYTTSTTTTTVTSLLHLSPVPDMEYQMGAHVMDPTSLQVYATIHADQSQFLLFDTASVRHETSVNPLGGGGNVLQVLKVHELDRPLGTIICYPPPTDDDSSTCSNSCSSSDSSTEAKSASCSFSEASEYIQHSATADPSKDSSYYSLDAILEEALVVREQYCRVVATAACETKKERSFTESSRVETGRKGVDSVNTLLVPTTTNTEARPTLLLILSKTLDRHTVLQTIGRVLLCLLDVGMQLLFSALRWFFVTLPLQVMSLALTIFVLWIAWQMMWMSSSSSANDDGGFSSATASHCDDAYHSNNSPGIM